MPDVLIISGLALFPVVPSYGIVTTPVEGIFIPMLLYNFAATSAPVWSEHIGRVFLPLLTAALEDDVVYVPFTLCAVRVKKVELRVVCCLPFIPSRRL